MTDPSPSDSPDPVPPDALPDPPPPGSGGPGPGAVREAARLFHGGVALLPVLSVILVLGLEISVPDAIFCAFLLGTLPLLSMAQLPLLQQGTVDRLPAYAGSVAMLVLLACVALVLGHLGPGLDSMGLSLAWGPEEWRTSGAVVGAVAVLAVAFHVAERGFGLRESPLLMELIPRTAREKGLFAVLSLAAGFCEEVVFRGYLLALLTPLFSGPWTVAVVSSMAFSILHAYQGPLGIVRSGLLGFLFATAFILTGNLWPLIVVHTAIDIVSGLVLGPRMLQQEHASA